MGRRRKSGHDLPPRLYERHGAFYHVCGGKWVRLSNDRAEAIRLWAEREGETVVRKRDTVAGLIDRYLAEVSSRKAKETFRKDRAMATNLIKTFGQMPPATLRPTHVAQYLDHRGQTAPVAANREKALLSHIYTMAMRWGWVDHNPCRGVHRNTERPRSRYVTDADFRAVYREANQTVRDAMDLSYLTALRISDVLALRINADRDGVLLVTQQKTGGQLAIKITDALRAVLIRCKTGGSIKGVTLLHNRAGRQYSYTGFASMFYRAMKKADCEAFTFHDIRAKALTDLERAGVPRSQIQELAGHKSGEMTERYIKAREVPTATALVKVVG